jgi:branched-chain amino acid transport system substrate-binding protein
MKKVTFIWLISVLLFIVINTFVLAGCSSPNPTASSPTTSSTPKTLKLGFDIWTSNLPGVNWAQEIPIIADMINKSGGLDVGGEKYIVNPIMYDNGAVQTSVLANANRLIYEDKVKFMMVDNSVESIIPVTEKGNTLLFGLWSPIADQYSNNYHYTYFTGFDSCKIISTTDWFMKKFPNKKRGIYLAPDSQMGHAMGESAVKMLKNLSLDITDVYYPASQTDLSSVGTKMKSENPDFIMMPALFPIKAIRDAGWTGQFFIPYAYSTETLLSMAPADALEGLIGISGPLDFDPPLTQMATDFKAAYIQKYNKWEPVDMLGPAVMYSMLTAIQKAGSVDIDKVSTVLSNGIVWESPLGMHKMVARADVGNTRTTDSVSTFYMKEIKDGKAILLDTIQYSDAEKSYTDYRSHASTPQTSTAGK